MNTFKLYNLYTYTIYIHIYITYVQRREFQANLTEIQSTADLFLII